MTNEEKMGLLEEMFEADAGTISLETALDTLQWDSMSMLSLIALVNEKFGKKLAGSQLRGFKKIADIIAVME
jgi:acyl carrier protein